MLHNLRIKSASKLLLEKEKENNTKNLVQAVTVLNSSIYSTLDSTKVSKQKEQQNIKITYWGEGEKSMKTYSLKDGLFSERKQNILFFHP